jgi:hypothetical protein
LDHEAGVRELSHAARMVEVQMGEDEIADGIGVEAGELEGTPDRGRAVAGQVDPERSGERTEPRGVTGEVGVQTGVDDDQSVRVLDHEDGNRVGDPTVLTLEEATEG